MVAYRIIPVGDVDLDANGRVVILEGAAYVAQHIARRFKFFLGEWFLDEREGIPYFRDVFTKNPQLDVIRSTFKKVLSTTPGVSQILRFNIVYTPEARTLAFDFAVRVVTNETIVVTPSDEPFILQVAA